MLGRVATAVGAAGGVIGSVDLISADAERTLRDITVDAAGEDHAQRIGAAVKQINGARLIDTMDRTFRAHVGGKIEQRNKLPLNTRDDLSMAYTPGVARVCSAIAEDREKAFQYTIKRNTVAVVSDGTAVLGLGDIGPEAAMPVMEGKCALFKEFGGVDAFPICLDTKDPDSIVATVKHIAPAFGGIKLEDISAPRCFPRMADDNFPDTVVLPALVELWVRLARERGSGRRPTSDRGSGQAFIFMPAGRDEVIARARCASDQSCVLLMRLTRIESPPVAPGAADALLRYAPLRAVDDKIYAV
jgi:hypothetical protein